MRFVRRSIAAALLASSVLMIPVGAASAINLERECIRKGELLSIYEETADTARDNGDFITAFEYTNKVKYLQKWLAANCL